MLLIKTISSFKIKNMKPLKKTIILKYIALIFFALSYQNCDHLIISSTIDTPLPIWFHPNRYETIRYVYFPDHTIYYDLSLRHYIYLNNGAWITSRSLPPRYSHLNLNRSRYHKIKDYRGDNIKSYHDNNYKNRRRRY